jgi:hypothetical protein
MKDFVRASGRLRNLPLPARVTYSVFLVFTLLALGFSAWLGAEMVGANGSGVDAYYAGVAPPPMAAAPPAADGGGPALDIPSDVLPARPPDADPMPLRKLLEVTHFHLFSMPVYLMILAHLFMLSRWGVSAKVTWIALATLSVVLHLAAPWVARSHAPGARLFYALSGGLLMMTFVVLALVPLHEMWGRVRAQA